MRLRPWSDSRATGKSDDIANKSLTAGGERKNIGDRPEAERIRKQRQDWQPEAITYTRVVGPLKAGCRYRASMISKVRVTPAWVPGPGKLPVPLGAADSDGGPLTPVPDSVRSVADDLLSRLDQSPGGLPALLYELTFNIDSPGECWLVGLGARQERIEAGRVTPAMDERWEIKSILEVTTRDGKYVIDNAPKAVPGGVLTEDDFIARLWQQDPFSSDLADSPTRGVLNDAEEILILQRAARAWGLSRLNAGLLFMSTDFSFGPPDPTQGQDAGMTGHDVFKHDFQGMIATPIQEEGSAGAVVPGVVWGPTEAIEKGVKHLTFDRPIDKELDSRLELRVRSLARGMDLPPERVIGHSDTTFANASVIDVDEFRGYLEPTVMMECAMLTSAFFRPLLEASGVARDLVKQLVVWYDPSELVAEPDRRPSANDGHDRLTISDATWRRETGYSEDDAPSDEEIERRLAQRSGPALPEPVEEATTAAATPPALTAAARSDIGRRLMEIDRALRSRLESLADYHVKRALEKFGATVRSKTAAASKKAIDAVPNHLVPGTLGRAVVAAIGLTEDELLESSFDDLRDEYDQRVRRGQRAALDVLARSGALDDDERAELETQQDEDRESSWAWFLASLLGLARTRLFDPTPAATPGEFDSLATVPPGVIREAVARAGGAKGLESRGGALSTAGGTQPAGGIGTGQLVQDTFARHGWQVTGWEWVYGDPSTRQSNFQPHLDLDGQEIKDWNSDDLSVGEDSWLATTGYRPGDHRGCSCSFIPVYAEGAA